MHIINDNHVMAGSWDVEPNRELYNILDNFLPFHPSNNNRKQNFEKMEKTPGDIIILHMFIINDNHLMYCS